MRLQSRPQHRGHDLYLEAAAGNVYWTKHASILWIYWPDENLRCSQQEGSLDSPRTQWMSTEIHENYPAPPWRHKWPGPHLWGYNKCLWGQQWSEAGYALVLIMFNIFSCMQSHTVQDLKIGVHIQYFLDGSLFDLRCLKESDLQLMLDHFSEASKLFGLTISLSKTGMLH